MPGYLGGMSKRLSGRVWAVGCEIWDFSREVRRPSNAGGCEFRCPDQTGKVGGLPPRYGSKLRSPQG